MPSTSDVIKSFQAMYPVATLKPSQALDALSRIRAAAVDVRDRTLSAAIDPFNLPTAQGICADSVAQMEGLIRRIDDVYRPYLEGLASDPATDTPGAGALVTVFYNAGVQVDPDTGDKFTTPEYVAPVIARNSCGAAEQTMIEAYKELVEDAKAQASEIGEDVVTATRAALPLAAVALGLGALLVMRSK